MKTSSDKKDSPRSILVIRMSSIGDIVLTASFFSGLRKLHPKSRILWLVRREYSEILSSHPAVDETVTWDKTSERLSDLSERLKRKNPGLVIDLHDIPRTRAICKTLAGNGSEIIRCEKYSLARLLLVLFKIPPSGEAKQSVKERYASLLSRMGLSRPVEKSGFTVPDKALKRARALLPSGFRGYVTVSEEATAATKRWEKYSLLMEWLLSEKQKVVLIGKEKSLAHLLLEEKYPKTFVNLTGKTSLLESASVIGLGKALVCNDTGMMHIGDALGVRTVSIWGPTVRQFGFFPSGKNSRVIEVEHLGCRPCSLHGSRRCPLGHFRCMKDIAVSDVVAALKA
jgi:heptosyltransferase-2